MKAGQLSPLQLELLKIYSFSPTEEELVELKKILATFFANRLLAKVNLAIEEKGITNDDLETWLDES